MLVRLAFPRRLLLRAPTTWVLGQALLASPRKKRPLATPWSHLLWVPLQRTWSPVVRIQSPNLQSWLVVLLGCIPLWVPRRSPIFQFMATWVLGQALLASPRKKRPLATPWSHLLRTALRPHSLLLGTVRMPRS